MRYHNNRFSARFFKAVYENTSICDCCNAISNRSDTIYLFDKDRLLAMLVDFLPEYNHQEAVNHIQSFCNRFDLNNEKLDFFDVLFDFSDNIVVRFENSFCFDYNYTDIWKVISKEIGEESFVISEIVQNDLKRKYYDRKDMNWPFNIEHDNYELKKLLRRGEGVSENHFHLRGSSPYFDTSWVFLMNDISNDKYEENLKVIENNRLNCDNYIRDDYLITVMWRKASAIRLILYMLVNIGSPEDNTDVDEYYKTIYMEVIPYENRPICAFPIGKIQEEINRLNIGSEVDYAACFSGNHNQKYRAFSGERYLIYTCLKKILCKEKDYKIIKELLFLYLIIKHRFYSEMVQSNSKIGFFNFAEYQNRKDYIIPWEKEEDVVTDTICSVIENNKIHRVELRITPNKDPAELANYIEMNDRAIKKAIKITGTKKYLSKSKNFFYTLHFTKKAETTETYQKGFCRSRLLRDDIKIRAHSIDALRSNPLISSRIYGIDACSAEIDCRPEVFGVIFRQLKDYDTYKKCSQNVPQLKATYHVGEDNYDIVDGIRAIDEAILFLNLRSGCRLGHATFLGLDAFEFYKDKNPISMPMQNFLDNVVWMYYFIEEYSITFNELPNLMSYLENMFEKYFHEIFSDSIQTFAVLEYLENFEKNKKTSKSHSNRSVNSEKCKFDMYNYFLSHLLRGDEPDLYKNGYYCSDALPKSNEYQICKTLDKMDEGRRSFEACYLYYTYHYNYEAVTKGMETIIEKLPNYFIKGVDLVQKKLREIISDKGIAIETNPTSNLYISPIQNYSEHPISTFYDNGLSKTPGSVQLNVSINTDDKSVFSTSLSNEYAYLMFYLEHQTDADGNRKFSRFEILNWLDEIRKMGNEQSFLRWGNGNSNLYHQL